ncbi:MAG: PD-(D/E)XK nuclease family protein [bacterium]
MPLHLRYLPSGAPNIPEILTPLIQEHIAFKLQDSFRIIVPDAESRQDLEEFFLEREALGGVLIGKSLLTLNAFAQALLLEHPRVWPLAPLALQRKALRESLARTHPQWDLDNSALERCLRELQELRRHGTAGPKTPAGKVAVEYHSCLGDAGYWDLNTSQQAAWEALAARRLGRSLAEVRVGHFLGFRLPLPALLDAVEAWLRAFPAVELYLYLPTPESWGEAAEKLEAWRRRMEGLAASVDFGPDTSSGEISVQPYPTPAHESRALLQRWREQAQGTRILAPGFAPVTPLLMAELGALDSADALQASESQLPALLLERLSLLPEAPAALPLPYSGVLERLAPAFQELQTALVQTGDYDSLRLLDAYRQWALDCAQAERWRPRERPWQEWLEDLTLDWTESRSSTGSALSGPLRRTDRPGLARCEDLLLAGMNEGSFPPGATPSFFEDEGLRTVSLLDASLAFRQSLSLPRRGVTLSFSQFSLSGRALSHSPWLDELKNVTWLPARETLLLRSRGGHPYFSENVRREALRHGSEPGLDAGDLRPLGLREIILERLRRQPLSATYLDDFAKCPWRFFARWHLQLSEEPREDLEIDPRRRGSLMHELLEKSFRSLLETCFRRGKVPSATELEACLQTAFARWSESTLAEASPVPEVLRRDQLERLRRSVAALLEAELESWNEAPRRLLPAQLEWRFGRGGVPSLSIPLEPGLEIPLTGAVDRIDLSEDGTSFLLIDYKSSGGENLAREIREGLSLQLWIYLQAVRQLLYPQAEALGGLYWDLKKLKKNQGMARREAYQAFSHQKLHGQNQSFLKEEGFAELEARLEAAVGDILKRILAGDYALKPAECLGARCEFREICRYEDKPRN